MNGAGAGGWDGKGREWKQRETLAVSPPAPAPSLLRWAGGDFPPPGDSTCLAFAWVLGVQSEPPTLSRYKALLRHCAGESRHLPRRKAGEETQSFPISLSLLALPHLPLF